MTTLLQKIDRVLRFLQAENTRLTQELADAKAALAEALADDAADAESIREAQAAAAAAQVNANAAQAAADAATARANTLQGQVDADQAEDQEIEGRLASVDVPEDFE